MVSLNTSPQEGFSRKRRILPSSSVITTPYSRGFSTRVRVMVAIEPFSLWNLTISVRSKSVSASPLMMMKVSFRYFWHIFTLPAVPMGWSSIE